jgi:Amt family ammonium transporter
MDINTLFLLVGGILALLATFGLFLKQAGGVRKKNSTSAFALFPLTWIFAVLGYFLVGFFISYGYHFFLSATDLNAAQGYQGLRFFFLASLACLIPAILTSALAERAKFPAMVIASTLLVTFLYPLLEGTLWGNLSWINGRTGILQSWLGLTDFHDWGGAVSIQMLAGFAALGGVLVLGPRLERYSKDGKPLEFVPHSPLLYSLGNWLVALALIGIAFSRYAGDLSKATALVPMNILLGIVGGGLAMFLRPKENWHIRQNSILAGAIAVLAGADVFHPLAALVVGLLGGALFLFSYRLITEKIHLDDALGVWPLHGLVGAWGGIACGIAGYTFLGGLGGVNFLSQLVGTIVVALVATAAGLAIFYALRVAGALRMSHDEERLGLDIVALKMEHIAEEIKKK